MKGKFKLFLPIVLCITLLFGSTSFAMSQVGNYALGFFSDKVMNSYSLTHYADSLDSEKKLFVKECLPTLGKKLNFPSVLCSYSVLDNRYSRILNLLKAKYSSWDDMDSNWSEAIAFIDSNFIGKYPITSSFFGNSSRGWYDDLAEYCIEELYIVGSDNPQLVGGNTFTQSIYNLGYDLQAQELIDMGVVDLSLISYKHINSSNFSNIEIYNNFISLCDSLKNDYDFVAVAKTNTTVNIMFIKGHIYSDSSNLNGHLMFCNDSGVTIKGNQVKAYSKGSSNTFGTWSTPSQYGSTIIGKFDIGAPSMVSVSGLSSSYDNSVGWSVSPKYVYTLNDDGFNGKIFTSLNGWINYNGHFEQSFVMPSTVSPSVTYSSNDMIVTYYNLSNGGDWSSMGGVTNTDGSINDSYNNIYNYYITNNGGSNDGGGGGSDDDDLGFFDKLFSSIGKLLKKIIEGIATIISDVVDGLGSIVDTIIGAVENLISWFTDENSGIFRFLKLFLEWLPEPIPTLLMTFFSLSIIFAVVKLVKGALS